MKVFGYDPKAGSKHAHTVDAAVTLQTEDEPSIYSFNQSGYKMKGLNHYLLCSMLDEVPKFLAPF